MEWLVGILIIAVVAFLFQRFKTKEEAKKKALISEENATDGYSNMMPFTRKYFQGSDKVEEQWSTLSDMEKIDDNKAVKFEKLCKNNIDDLYAMLNATEEHDGNIEEMPDEVPAYNRLTMLYERQGRIKEAMETCVESIINGAISDGSIKGMRGRLATLVEEADFDVSKDVLELLD